MAVGTIANISISAYSTYVNVSFAKPANTTKYVVTVTDAVNSYISPFSQTFSFSSSAVGSTVTCRVTGMNAGGKYYVSVTPYNGTTAGTTKQYSNSGTQNLVIIPKTTTTAQAGTTSGTSSSTTSTVGNGSINPTSPTGSTANGGSSGTSSAAPSNTPVFNPGSVSTSAPSDINSSARISQKVEGLDPNTPYSIDIRAVTTDASGNTIYSEWSPKLNIITPGYSTDSNNFQSVNNATDIQLSGGSIFAGTFDVSTGIIDVVNDTVNGSGVILNQTGLLGVNSGTKEFYLDAATGNAYFAGTIGATVIQSTNYSPSIATSEPLYTQAGMKIDLNNGSISSKSFRITSDGTAYFAGSIAANATINGVTASTVVSNAATGITKNVTFTQGTQPTALNIGDLWYDSSNGFKSYRWNGTTWVSVQDASISTAQSAANAANTNALAAQTSANGKNRIIYGARGSDATHGQAPDLQTYQITQGTTSTSVNSSTGSVTTSTTGQVNTFPSQISNTSGNIAGDTWFVLNNYGSVIAQYTVNSAATYWVWTTVSSQIIGNLDAGMITTGTLSAVNINNNTGTFAVDTYGNLKATSAYITGKIVGSSIYGGTLQTTTTANSGNYISISNSNNAISFYSGTTGYAHITPLTGGTTTYGLVIHQGSTADSTGGTYPQMFIGNNILSLSANTPSAVANAAFLSFFKTSGSLSIGGNVSYSSKNLGWTQGTNSVSYKLLGADTAGNFAQMGIGLWYSGSYGSSTPPSSIGDDGDYLFSS